MLSKKEYADFMESERLKSIERDLKEKEKRGEIVKMVKVDDGIKRKDVCKYESNPHQFCYSGLHW